MFWAWNFQVLNWWFNEQSDVILWVKCKKKSLWQLFTCKRYFLSFVFGKKLRISSTMENQMRIHKGIGPFLWALDYVTPYHRSLLKQIATLFCSGGFILVPSFLSLIDILFSSSSIKKVGWYFETIEWQRNWFDSSSI